MCSSAGRAAVSKAAGRGFESLRTRTLYREKIKSIETMTTSKPMSQEINEKKQRTGVLQFIEGIKSEFKRISWTDREELLSYTKMVVLATFISGFAIFGVDLALQKLLSLLGLSY